MERHFEIIGEAVNGWRSLDPDSRGAHRAVPADHRLSQHPAPRRDLWTLRWCRAPCRRRCHVTHNPADSDNAARRPLRDLGDAGRQEASLATPRILPSSQRKAAAWRRWLQSRASTASVQRHCTMPAAPLRQHHPAAAASAPIDDRHMLRGASRRCATPSAAECDPARSGRQRRRSGRHQLAAAGRHRDCCRDRHADRQSTRCRACGGIGCQSAPGIGRRHVCQPSRRSRLGNRNLAAAARDRPSDTLARIV